MPLLETRGAASAAGFGFGASKGGAVAPFIARLTTSVRTANLFDDGSVLVMADGSSNLDFGILAAGTHTNSATKTAGSSYYGSGVHFDTAKTNATTGVLGYVQGFAAVTNTNTVSLAKSSSTAQGFGGAPDISTAVDSAGNIYLASSVYGSSNTSYLLPCVRKYNSSGVFQWSYIYSSVDPSTSNNAYISGIAVGADYVYVTIQDFEVGYPVVLSISKSSGAVNSAFYFSESIYIPYGISAPAVDASSNVHFAVVNFVDGGANLYQLSSNLYTVNINKRITGAGDVLSGSGVAIDSATGNVFWLLGQTWNNARVLKTNSAFASPSVISVSDTSASYSYASNFQVTANSMCFVNSGAKLIFVLPLDGTKTGTYSVGGISVTYSSVATPTIVNGTTSPTFIGYYNYSQSVTSNDITMFTGTPFTVSSVNL